MDKVKKSITLGKNIIPMLKELSDLLGIGENAVISVAVLEFYKRNIWRDSNINQD